MFQWEIPLPLMNVGRCILIINSYCSLQLPAMTELRDIWESTSFALEMLQCNPKCVLQVTLIFDKLLIPYASKGT